MNERLTLLISTIQSDIKAIDDIFADLPAELIVADPLQRADEDAMIVVAYRLHNLYNAFENIFENIAAHFENSIEDQGRWHTQLLERMRLNAMPLRPAVIDAATFDMLDELRRFRYLFRHAYTMHLDPKRLDLVLYKANDLRTVYRPQLERFIEFLQTSIKPNP